MEWPTTIEASIYGIFACNSLVLYSFTTKSSRIRLIITKYKNPIHLMYELTLTVWPIVTDLLKTTHCIHTFWIILNIFFASFLQPQSPAVTKLKSESLDPAVARLYLYDRSSVVRTSTEKSSIQTGITILNFIILIRGNFT
jgi:hypothetical protein